MSESCAKWAPDNCLAVPSGCGLLPVGNQVYGITRRGSGNYAGQSYYLNVDFEWALVRDDDNAVVLVARKKGSGTP